MSSKPVVQCLADELTEVVDKYCELGVTVAETIGALELVHGLGQGDDMNLNLKLGDCHTPTRGPGYIEKNLKAVEI